MQRKILLNAFQHSSQLEKQFLISKLMKIKFSNHLTWCDLDTEFSQVSHVNGDGNVVNSLAHGNVSHHAKKSQSIFCDILSL